MSATQLLDHQQWQSRVELALAAFKRTEGSYNRRRHTALGMMSPRDADPAHRRHRRGMITSPKLPGKSGQAPRALSLRTGVHAQDAFVG
jgi:hypothetical protein